VGLVIALGMVALIWLVVMAWLWEASQMARAVIARRNTATQLSQQQ